MVRWGRASLATVLLLFGATAQGNAAGVHETVIQRVARDFDLDTAHHSLEIVSSSLEDTEVVPDQLTLRPLSLKEPLGLFTVVAEIAHEDGHRETGQVHLRIRKFDTVLVAGDRIRRHETFDSQMVALAWMDV